MQINMTKPVAEESIETVDVYFPERFLFGERDGGRGGWWSRMLALIIQNMENGVDSYERGDG